MSLSDILFVGVLTDLLRYQSRAFLLLPTCFNIGKKSFALDTSIPCPVPDSAWQVLSSARSWVDSLPIP